ncbi:uncharacterized protein LOC123228967 [Mangifera indica]|uniref:uncharacterized protein LOC123228967 n=1 Tax=Mangifera indica TaxID=29780 RepID=UPI001CFB9AA1|nr:uncharacterized protein LOC123228967 [Mangifera indica]
MESSSSFSALGVWNYLNLFLLRPILAVSFVLSFILLGWFLAWKLILVHVPVIQDIFGLRQKRIEPKATSRGRFSEFYKTIDGNKSEKTVAGSAGDQLS